MNALYPAMLRAFYAINAGLKRDGILAPAISSINNTKKLYDMIGKPLDNIPTIHIGGTNGKGTTSFKVSESLRLGGVRTGLFVSPHLSSFRERVQVDSQLIPEDCFVKHLSTLLELCSSHNIPATEFELAFLLASLHFKHSACQAVVLEVGLGGEYDATNVVSTAVSVICSVSLDHTRILGSTVDAVARNKAGIFKPNRPALIGPDVRLSMVQDIAADRGTLLYTFDNAWRYYTDKNWIASAPSHTDNIIAIDKDHIVDTDALNADISLLALCLLKEHVPSLASLDVRSAAVQRGLALRPPCRWEIFTHYVQPTNTAVSSTVSSDNNRTCDMIPVTAILDMGHNPAAIDALCRRIKRDFQNRNVRVVYAMSRDKDVRACLRTVLSVIPHDRIHFIQSGNFRAVSRDDLCALFREETGGEEMTHIAGNNIQEYLEAVFKIAAVEATDEDYMSEEKQNINTDLKPTDNTPVVIICGTGYVMPEARAFLGVVEARDSIDLQRT